tara:strand:+ start:5115 stop:5339 length:225 start_codon:yes stop_codon:yes gene_type:complete
MHREAALDKHLSLGWRPEWHPGGTDHDVHDPGYCISAEQAWSGILFITVSTAVFHHLNIMVMVLNEYKGFECRR